MGTMIGIGFVVRSVVPALRGIDPRVREAAATLGASPGQIRRRIDARIARPALIVGAGFAFAVSLGEFGATSFVGRNPRWMTAPLAIGRLLSQPGQRSHAMAMALGVVVVVMTALVIGIVDRRGSRLPV